MAYEAKVIADSICVATRKRVTTIQVTLPRIVLAEFNTHRQLSRNSASSRAIPVAKMIERVNNDPFVPIYWGKNQKGMQASEELVGEERQQAKEHWLLARDHAVNQVWALVELDVHKQTANRLLEPFLWHTIVATATEWSNFFALRCHPLAQPEIRVAAEMMRDAMLASTPVELPVGGWHLPYVNADDVQEWPFNINLAKVSAARCARVSYLTQEGTRDVEADLRLFERLVSASPPHASPFEHPCRAMGKATEPSGNFFGWEQYRKLLQNDVTRLYSYGDKVIG